MPIALVIAGKDLRQRLRDRSALVLGLVAPLVIAALMSLAFRGVESFHFNLGVVNADGGPVAAGLLRSLRAPQLAELVTVTPVTSAAAAATEVRDRKVQAALVIPKGFSASMAAAAPLPLTTLRSVNNAVAGSITASLAASFVAQLDADRLSVVTALAAGAATGDASRLGALAGRLRIPEQLAARPVGARQLKTVSYYSPAMAIFFLLFTIGFTARSFYVDRAQGMIERMLAAPVRPIDVLAGKALSVFVFGLSSLTVVALVTSAAFGAYWGSPPAVAAVFVALVLSVVSVTALVIAVARTQRQAEWIASAVVFGLALLGGNFVFLSVSPQIMQRLALLTPNGWALRAFTDLATTGGGLRTAAVPVLAIVAFSVAVGAVAVRLARRAVSL